MDCDAAKVDYAFVQVLNMNGVVSGAQGAPLSLRVLQVFETCSGRGVMVGPDPRAPRASEVGDVELALASLLSEREASGASESTVALRMAHRDDARWIPSAMAWLAARGRRVVVRTRVALPKPVVERARELGASVMLELAARRPDLQSALLGPQAESAARLLLAAQHLRSSDVQTAVVVGPVLAVLHDRIDALGPMFQHIAAADLRDVHLSLGRLRADRLEALQAILPWSDVSAIGRAYGAPHGDPSAIPATGARLPERDANMLFHSARRQAEAAGLRVDECGCSALCHVGAAKPRPFLARLTPELFPDAG